LQGLKLIRESLDVVRYKSVPKNRNQLLAFLDLPVFLLFLFLYPQNNFSIIQPYAGTIALSGLVFILIFELINAERDNP
jgi:ABC-type protease/lipase transport system fused ATPase/permease subunit